MLICCSTLDAIPITVHKSGYHSVSQTVPAVVHFVPPVPIMGYAMKGVAGVLLIGALFVPAAAQRSPSQIS